MSKKNVLLISFTAFLLQVCVLIFGYVGFDSCYKSLACQEWVINPVDVIINYIFVLVPVFFLSLITYKMRDEVYRMWVRFSYVWIPLSMIAIFFAPAYSGDWMYPIDKNSIAFLASVLFIVISLAIIAWKYIAIRKIR